MAIVLLYTAGLRRGEVLRLTLADVDGEAGVVRVRESKFHKSRLVPLSASAHGELCRYLRGRLAFCGDARPTAPLLCNHSRGWRPYTGTGLRDGINRLFDQAGVRDPQQRRPRVHDLRHSFAVQALTRLQRRGENVQTRLPHLALKLARQPRTLPVATIREISQSPPQRGQPASRQASASSIRFRKARTRTFGARPILVPSATVVRARGCRVPLDCQRHRKRSLRSFALRNIAINSASLGSGVPARPASSTRRNRLTPPVSPSPNRLPNSYA